MDGQSLNSKASQETFISLLQLDPAPMETPPADREKELPPLPEEPSDSSHKTASRTSTSSSIGLSGSGHGAIYYLTRIQRYSSYTFTLFASLHLATTSVIPLVVRSVPASESYLLLAREVYQTPLSEPVLVVLPILAHVAAGVTIRLLRRSQNLRRYGGATPAMPAVRRQRPAQADGPGHLHHQPRSFSHAWPELSYVSLAGYALAPILAAHAFLNRILPLIVEGDSANIGLAYVGHGFARHGPVAWLAYGGLLVFGCGHMVWGWATWLGLSQRASWTTGHLTGNTDVDRRTRKKRRRMWLTLHGTALGVLCLWAGGGLGVVARSGLTKGWVGKVYDGLYWKIGM